VTRDEFLTWAREQVADEYGGVPIGIDEALERIADRFEIEVAAARSRARTEAGAW
jgi:hypothetical protein